MKKITLSNLRTLLAAEFERRGWPYSVEVGAGIVESAKVAGRTNAKTLAKSVSGTFLDQNDINRTDIEDAIKQSVGDCELVEENATPAQVTNYTNSIHLGPGAAINQSKINIGGVQVEATANKDELLKAVAMLVKSGLDGTWNSDEARALEDILERRKDITAADVQEITTEQVKKSPKNTVKKFLSSVSTSTLGGILSYGMIAALSAAVGQPPPPPMPR